MSDEIELLILQLSASLPPPEHFAFIADARSTLAGVTCIGPGLAYRLLKDVQRRHFDPPPDDEANRSIGLHMRRRSKLIEAEAIGRDDPRTGGRDRRRLRAVVA